MRDAKVLELHYDGVMKDNVAPLFRTFEKYLGSLPVRSLDFAGDLKLIEVPFFAREEDMQVMVTRLEDSSSTNRNRVKYAVSPTCTGKTASICSAFLKSATSANNARFSHYLYLTFSNNGGNRFVVIDESKISASKKGVAEYQGAVFMKECLEKLLNGEEGLKQIKVPGSKNLIPRDLSEVAREIETLLDNNLVTGRILVHVDEHRKMADSSNFRKGALSALAIVQRVEVVATYVDIPAEIPGDDSSAVYRYPIPIPLVDVDAAARHAEIEMLDEENIAADQKRLLATLKFRLAIKLTQEMTRFHYAYSLNFEDTAVTKIHGTYKPEISEAIKMIMKAYQDCVSGKNTLRRNSKRVKQLARLTSTEFGTPIQKPSNEAMDLLLGMADTEIDNLPYRLSGRLISIANKKKSILSHGFHDLFSRDPEQSETGYQVYVVAKGLFKAVLTGENDLLSGTPLERSYLWSLSVLAARKGVIAAGNMTLNVFFTCKKIRSGRVFTGTTADAADVDLTGLSKECIYYPLEREGDKTHPIGDIFFLSNEEELVLIDITACTNDSNSMTRKRRNIRAFIDSWRREPPQGLKLVIAIVNPLELKANTRPAAEYSELRYIYGDDAKELLGGLLQFGAWY